MCFLYQWKYLAKWVGGTNCTYHQKIYWNSFQTYALGNEPVSLTVSQRSVLFWLYFASWHCFLMCSLLVCSESVVLLILRLLLWEAAVTWGSLFQLHAILLVGAQFPALSTFLSSPLWPLLSVWCENHYNRKGCRGHFRGPYCHFLPQMNSNVIQ